MKYHVGPSCENIKIHETAEDGSDFGKIGWFCVASTISTTLRAYCAMTRGGEYLKALSVAEWQARPTGISRQVAEAIGSRDIASYEVLRNSQYRRMRTGISHLWMFLQFYTDGEFTEHEETLPVIHQQFLVSEWGCPLPNACLLVNTTKRHAFTHTLLNTLLVGRHGHMKCNLQTIWPCEQI